MSCICRERMQRKLDSLRKEADYDEKLYKRRLDAFKEGVKEGVDEIAIRHLYRAGVYLACLKNNYAKDVGLDMVLIALDDRLRIEGPDLYRYYASNRNRVAGQSMYLDPPSMLIGILRQKNKAEGLLRANIEKELKNCRRARESAQQLDNRLNAWKEGIGGGQQPMIECITDRHNHSK